MSVTTTLTNGRPQRQQLSDQPDRLDQIITVLDDGLPGAVADAAREGTRLAVKDAHHPDLHESRKCKLIGGLAAPVMRPTAPGARSAAARSGRGPTPSCKRHGPRLPRGFAKRDHPGLTATVRGLAEIMPLRKFLLIGTAIGMAAAAISYTCPHNLLVVVSGISAACTAVAVQVGRLVPPLGPAVRLRDDLSERSGTEVNRQGGRVKFRPVACFRGEHVSPSGPNPTSPIGPPRSAALSSLF